MGFSVNDDIGKVVVVARVSKVNLVLYKIARQISDRKKYLL